MKGQNKHLVSCDAITSSTSENQNHNIHSKTQKKQISHLSEQYKLDEEKESRLGRLCHTAQWIIKIAQNRGAMACLMVKSVEYVGRKEGAWTVIIQTADNQRLNLSFPGRWFEEAKKYFVPHQCNPFIISGTGVIIHPSSDRLIFSGGTCCLYMLDISQFKTDTKHSTWHGWLDVSEQVVVETPSLCETSNEAAEDASIDDDDEDDTQNEPTPTPPKARQVLAPVKQTGIPTPPADFVETKQKVQTNIPKSVPKKEAVPFNLSAKRKTVDEEDPPTNPTQKQRSITLSSEPDWLDTPASVKIDKRSNVNEPSDTPKSLFSVKRSNSDTSERSTIPNQTSSSNNNFRGAKMMSKKAIAEAQEERMIGGHLITPICKLAYLYKKQNTFGLVTSNEQIFRAGGGTGDFKLTVYLEDVFPLQGDKISITFNLFEGDQSHLPVCRAGDMLAILNFATKTFNGVVQGTGYRGSGWIVLSAETGKFRFSKNLEMARPMILCDEMRTHFDRMYKSIGTPAPIQNRRRRQMKLSDVEPTVFFNAEVQVVSTWDGVHPCIYVTDYTTHPDLPMAQDVRLNVYSQEDLKNQRDIRESEGGGRVMPIYVWEGYRDILADIKPGDYLTLRNVRPKLNPANFLEGNLGDKEDGMNPSRINVYHIHDEDIIKAIEERREAYQEEAAIAKAESFFQQSSSTTSTPYTATPN